MEPDNLGGGDTVCIIMLATPNYQKDPPPATLRYKRQNHHSEIYYNNCTYPLIPVVQTVPFSSNFLMPRRNLCPHKRRLLHTYGHLRSEIIPSLTSQQHSKLMLKRGEGLTPHLIISIPITLSWKYVRHWLHITNHWLRWTVWLIMLITCSGSHHNLWTNVVSPHAAQG